ncbi:MAG: Nramp family divalent metal transporter [Anaerolineae bacterium]
MIYLVAALIIVIIALCVIIVVLWRQTRRVALGLDEIAEDALKSLYHLSRQQPLVRPRDLIRAADLQPDRYPLIEAELRRRGWVRVGPAGLQVLPAGERRALELIRAHRLWERYLADREGLTLGAIHDEAMRREHLSTPEEIDALERELGYPRFDPHGDPIPTREGELAPEQGTPLVRWPLHRLGRIVHVEDEPPALFAQLALMGLTRGAQVEVDERMPGQVLVWSGRQRLSLTPAAAANIYVVEAPAERVPLSEIEVGQAARVAAIGEAPALRARLHAAGVAPGVEIVALRVDPLGDPTVYRVNGTEITLSRVDANQILLDALTIREVPLPRRSWLSEELAVIRELFVRYGSLAVLKRGLLFFGPAFVVSVGYMDPGNWGTDIEGGARFGYRLLWVIFLANMMAILLQTLAAKLGIATGKTLPEVCRDRYPRWASVGLWITAELAAMATDLAEFLGGAVGFNLLFGIPLFPAALLTGVCISLILLLERYGFRKVELVIIGLIAVIGFGYMLEIWLVKPPLGEVARGLFVPSLPVGATLVAVGIIGATVMPHNLYLHSALIQTRVRPSDSLARKKSVYRLAVMDALVALNGAFFVNSAILVMSASAFSGGRLAEFGLESAHRTLTPLLGPLAGIAFALALLASGLASSTTATMAGQVIMEGFIHHRMNVWLRRFITMLPTLLIIGLGIDPLRILVLSQVSLSFQLPFAMIPLVLFTSNPQIMGPFTNRPLTRWLAWGTTALIIGLNMVLLYQTVVG